MKLVKYNFKAKYRPGGLMISDYISRHPVNNYSSQSVAENYVNFITQHALPKSLRLNDMATATKDDCVIKCVMDALSTNKWKQQKCSKSNELKCYEQLSNELSVVHTEQGTVLLRGTRICVPQNLQRCVVDLAHRVIKEK